MKRKKLMAPLVLLTFEVLGCGLAGAQPKTIEVTIEHFKFEPEQIDVVPGDTIRFTNKDIAPHTATAKDNSWTTMTLKQGENGNVIIDAKSGLDFICKFHPMMKGQIKINAVQ